MLGGYTLSGHRLRGGHRLRQRWSALQGRSTCCQLSDPAFRALMRRAASRFSAPLERLDWIGKRPGYRIALTRSGGAGVSSATAATAIATSTDRRFLSAPYQQRCASGLSTRIDSPHPHHHRHRHHRHHGHHHRHHHRRPRRCRHRHHHHDRSRVSLRMRLLKRRPSLCCAADIASRGACQPATGDRGTCQ